MLGVGQGKDPGCYRSLMSFKHRLLLQFAFAFFLTNHASGYEMDELNTFIIVTLWLASIWCCEHNKLVEVSSLLGE